MNISGFRRKKIALAVAALVATAMPLAALADTTVGDVDNYIISVDTDNNASDFFLL